MTWIKWETELLNLNKLSRISSIGKCVSSGRDKGNPEIRIYSGNSSAILVKTFPTQEAAIRSLAELENRLIKHNYDQGNT